jgi:hypothetical protein
MTSRDGPYPSRPWPIPAHRPVRGASSVPGRRSSGTPARAPSGGSTGRGPPGPGAPLRSGRPGRRRPVNAILRTCARPLTSPWSMARRASGSGRLSTVFSIRTTAIGAQQHRRVDGTARVVAVVVAEQLDRFLVLAAPAANLPRHQQPVQLLDGGGGPQLRQSVLDHGVAAFPRQVGSFSLQSGLVLGFTRHVRVAMAAGRGARRAPGSSRLGG